MAMITSTKHKTREHPWWVLSFGFYTAIDGLGEWGLFHVDDGGEGFQTFGFSLDVILPGVALERTMSWHLPW